MNIHVDKKNISYVIYARKSTEDASKQVQSIDDQIRVMKARAKRDGLKVKRVFSESISGGLAGKRPEFNKMVDYIESGKAEGVLAWKLDRLSRNPQDSGYLHQMMNDGKIKWILTDGRDYNSDDDIMFDVESSMDAKFRKDLMKNVRRGIYSKAEKGWMPCIPPIGYMNDYREKTIVKDPERWDKVRQLFDRFLTGTVTVAELTRYADQELGLKTYPRRKSGGKALSHSSVRNMLTNKFYTGRFKYGAKEYDGNQPVMLSVQEYERIQRLLVDQSHNTRPKKQLRPFIFRGLIKCGECGYAVTSETKTKKQKNGNIHTYTYCHCTGKCKTHKCSQKSIHVSEEKLIAQVKEELAKYTIDDDFFNLAIKALNEEEEMKIKDQNMKTRELRRQYDARKNELDNLRRMRYKNEITDTAWFNTESQSLEKEMERLQNSIDAVANAGKEWRRVADDIFLFARYAKEDFDSGDLERQQYVLRTLGAEWTLLGSNLTFTPVKYLVPIKKAISELSTNTEMARTSKQQGSEDDIYGLIKQWYAR